ncbi:MAG: hybrid sensor histidine kinase/response regulator [Bacteroidales bacterium]|nr:hybrid sensor histidine kinase/response regulator [Bacteroidales bacterium]
MFEENPKILIIDDIVSNIQVVANVLKKNNFNISYAQSGKSGIERAKQINFDLILLDIMMPEMDGYEVCTHLKKDPKTKDVPVIFLTAKTTEDSLKKGFDCGAVDFISKPFKVAELIARVNTHIQLKTIREILSETNKNLQEANANKDKLLSIIAHDLRNPFSVLITFSKLLLDSLDDFSKEDILNYLKTFYQTSKQGYNLLDNLLKWSKSQTGKMEIEPEVIDFKDIVEENITLLNSQAKSKKIKLFNELPEDLFAFADLNMILTVLRNLLTNAIKFTAEGGKIEVSGKDFDNYIEISVKDNGLGISEDDLGKIFRIDIKHSTTGTANERGSGLGLVLCKEFIEKNHGILTAKSSPGQGSEFIFTLPKPELNHLENHLNG